MPKPFSKSNKTLTPNEKTKAPGAIRIISGRHKGRKLPVLDSIGLRPTTDRVKETLFNWLMFQINDKNCLDLFSGSGSLGFEALSRGAKKVTMIEKEKKVYENLENSSKLLKDENIKIINTDALDFLKSTQESFDLIFLDPPFRKGILNEVFALLTPNIIPNNSLVYVEQEKENQSEPPSHFKLLKEGSAGQVIFRLYKIEWLN